MIYSADVTKNGETFRATLGTGRRVYMESVQRSVGNGWEDIHSAQFPARNIDGADRAEYTRVMCASIAAQWLRDNA